MLKIALLSDTHNHIDTALAKYLSPCDQIWHAGDVGTIAICDALKKIKPLVAVYGNIDGQDIRKDYPKVQRFTCEGLDVLMTHIGGYPGKYNPEVRNLIAEKPPKLFICGHSHILKVIYDKKYNLLHMNPGAAGNYGAHKVKTLLRFSISAGNIKDLELVEFGNL